MSTHLVPSLCGFFWVHPHYSAPCSCLNRDDCQRCACLRDTCVVSLSHISSPSVRKGIQFSLCAECNETCTSAGLVDEVFMTLDRYLLPDLWDSPCSPGWTNCFGAFPTLHDLFSKEISGPVSLLPDHCNRQIDKQGKWALGGLVVLKLKIKPARLSR